MSWTTISKTPHGIPLAMMWHREWVKSGMSCPRRRRGSRYLRILSTSISTIWDELFITSTLLLYGSSMLTNKIHHPVDVRTRLQTHAIRLLFRRQFRNRDVSLHMLPHQNCGMKLYNGSKKCIFAGKVAAKSPGSYSGMLYNLPERCSKKAFSENLSKAACWIFPKT